MLKICADGAETMVGAGDMAGGVRGGVDSDDAGRGPCQHRRAVTFAATGLNDHGTGGERGERGIGGLVPFEPVPLEPHPGDGAFPEDRPCEQGFVIFGCGRGLVRVAVRCRRFVPDHETRPYALITRICRQPARVSPASRPGRGRDAVR